QDTAARRWRGAGDPFAPGLLRDGTFIRWSFAGPSLITPGVPHVPMSHSWSHARHVSHQQGVPEVTLSGRRTIERVTFYVRPTLLSRASGLSGSWRQPLPQGGIRTRESSPDGNDARDSRALQLGEQAVHRP